MTTKAISLLTVVLVLSAFTLVRWRNGAFDRPLEYDEFVSVEYYSWGGLDPSGGQRTLRRNSDFNELSRPTVRQLAMGIYRSLGEWKEPNNHIVHSFLLNFSLLPGHPQEYMARIPALISGIAFALAVYLFVGHTMQWHFAAPFACVWAYTIPYTVDFSATARGYTLNLLLLVVHLLAAKWAAQRPSNLIPSGFQIATGVLISVNLISMAVDWVLPVTLAMMIFPPIELYRDPDSRNQLRKNLMIQLLITGAIGLVFLIDRLPYVVSSAQQYGIPFSGVGEFFTSSKLIFYYLFPNGLSLVFPILGIAGLLLLARSQEHRWLAFVFASVFVTSLMHFWASSKLPYARTCGYLLVPILLSAAFALESVHRKASPKILRWLVSCVAVAFTLLFSWQSASAPLNPGVSRFLARFAAVQEVLGESSCYAILPQPASYLISKNLPENWLTGFDRVDANTDIRQVVDLRHDPENDHRVYATTSKHVRSLYPVLNTAQEPETRDLSEGTAVLFIWYPNRDRLGISDDAIRRHFSDFQIAPVTRKRRFSAKLDFYHQLWAVEWIARNQADWERSHRLIEAGAEQFEGILVSLTLDPTDLEPGIAK